MFSANSKDLPDAITHIIGSMTGMTERIPISSNELSLFKSVIEIIRKNKITVQNKKGGTIIISNCRIDVLPVNLRTLNNLLGLFSIIQCDGENEDGAPRHLRRDLFILEIKVPEYLLAKSILETLRQSLRIDLHDPSEITAYCQFVLQEDDKLESLLEKVSRENRLHSNSIALFRSA
jgi:hypothetical protein